LIYIGFKVYLSTIHVKLVIVECGDVLSQKFLLFNFVIVWNEDWDTLKVVENKFIDKNHNAPIPLLI
jgi:hypothetical protein